MFCLTVFMHHKSNESSNFPIRIIFIYFFQSMYTKLGHKSILTKRKSKNDNDPPTNITIIWKLTLPHFLINNNGGLEYIGKSWLPTHNPRAFGSPGREASC